MIVRSVRLAPAAQYDIERLTSYLALRSERAAARAADVFTSAVLSLSEFSERGRPAGDPGWRELIVRFGRGAYVIRYKVEGETVFVTRIHHGREDR